MLSGKLLTESSTIKSTRGPDQANRNLYQICFHPRFTTSHMYKTEHLIGRPVIVTSHTLNGKQRGRIPLAGLRVMLTRLI